MAQIPPDVHIPAGVTISVKLINPVNFGPSKLSRFMEPPVEGLQGHPSVPSLCFLLEHHSGRKLVWDLGIRKDYTNYAPNIAEYIPTTGYTIDAPKNLSEILEDEGIPLRDIEAVIWRYVYGSGEICVTVFWANARQPLALGSHWRPIYVPALNRPDRWTWVQGSHAPRSAGESRLPAPRERMGVSSFSSYPLLPQVRVS